MTSTAPAWPQQHAPQVPCPSLPAPERAACRSQPRHSCKKWRNSTDITLQQQHEKGLMNPMIQTSNKSLATELPGKQPGLKKPTASREEGGAVASSACRISGSRTPSMNWSVIVFSNFANSVAGTFSLNKRMKCKKPPHAECNTTASLKHQGFLNATGSRSKSPHIRSIIKDTFKCPEARTAPT